MISKSHKMSKGGFYAGKCSLNNDFNVRSNFLKYTRFTVKFRPIRLKSYNCENMSYADSVGCSL